MLIQIWGCSSDENWLFKVLKRKKKKNCGFSCLNNYKYKKIEIYQLESSAVALVQILKKFRLKS
jgi:hypothetical protein